MNLIFGISEYRKEDYEEIYKLSEDKEDMEETWEEWKLNKTKAKNDFHKMGIKAII